MSAAAHSASASARMRHVEPAARPVITNTAITNASMVRSPSGYARLVATAANEPSVPATTPSTAAAPTAAPASAQTIPSSHSAEPSRGARARSSSIRPTHAAG